MSDRDESSEGAPALAAAEPEARTRSHGLRRYAPAFRREAVERYRRSGHSISEVALELGISPASLRRWVQQEEVDRRPVSRSREKDSISIDPEVIATGVAEGIRRSRHPSVWATVLWLVGATVWLIVLMIALINRPSVHARFVSALTNSTFDFTVVPRAENPGVIDVDLKRLVLRSSVQPPLEVAVPLPRRACIDAAELLGALQGACVSSVLEVPAPVAFDLSAASSVLVPLETTQAARVTTSEGEAVDVTLTPVRDQYPTVLVYLDAARTLNVGRPDERLIPWKITGAAPDDVADWLRVRVKPRRQDFEKTKVEMSGVGTFEFLASAKRLTLTGAQGVLTYGDEQRDLSPEQEVTLVATSRSALEVVFERERRHFEVSKTKAKEVTFDGSDLVDTALERYAVAFAIVLGAFGGGLATTVRNAAPAVRWLANGSAWMWGRVRRPRAALRTSTEDNVGGERQ